MAGELLKKRREELGLDLKEIADLLKIKADYLVSIEEDRFEKLPVAVYTTGYIRCYAAYLKIDPEPIIASYTGHLSHPPPSTIIPVSSSKKKMPPYFYIIPVLVVVLVFLLFYIFRQGSLRSGNSPAVPAAQPVQQVRPAQPVQQVQPVQPDRPQPAPARQEIVQSPPVPDAALQPRKKTGEHTLEIIANDLTWMHIRFSGGKYEEVLLRPGITRSWSFTDRAVLKLGNAGGVRLKLDGKDIGAPGSLGQVITLVFPEEDQAGARGGQLQ